VSKKLAELRDEVLGLCQNADKVAQAQDIDRAIERAVRVYSRKQPRLYFESFTGTGSAYEWALNLSYYLPQFSKVTTVEYPFEAVQVPGKLLVKEDFDVYEKTAAVWYFRLRYDTPSASEFVRVTYTALHSVTETASTVGSADAEDSIVMLAAAMVLRILAAKAVATSNSGLGADTVDYQSRSSQYASLATEYEKQSGLLPYLAQNEAQGGAIFVSLGRAPKATDYMTRG
jgi:hypothetical protein